MVWFRQSRENDKRYIKNKEKIKLLDTTANKFWYIFLSDYKRRRERLTEGRM